MVPCNLRHKSALKHWLVHPIILLYWWFGTITWSVFRRLDMGQKSVQYQKDIDSHHNVIVIFDMYRYILGEIRFIEFWLLIKSCAYYCTISKNLVQQFTIAGIAQPTCIGSTSRITNIQGYVTDGVHKITLVLVFFLLGNVDEISVTTDSWIPNWFRIFQKLD